MTLAAFWKKNWVNQNHQELLISRLMQAEIITGTTLTQLLILNKFAV